MLDITAFPVFLVSFNYRIKQRWNKKLLPFGGGKGFVTFEEDLGAWSSN